MRLISDLSEIQRAYNFDPVKDLLITNIRLDDFMMVTPLIAEVRGKRYLMAREQETGNLAYHGVPKEETRFFERYFSFNSVVDGWNTKPTLGEEVAELAEGESVEVQPSLPYGRYLQISKHAEVVAEAVVDDRSVVAHKIMKTDVLDRFQRLRAGGVEAATRVLRSRPHLTGLIDELEDGSDSRFSALDESLDSLGVQTLYAAAPPNLSELLGLKPEAGRAVLYNSGADHLFLLRPENDYAAPGAVHSRHSSLTAALRELGASTHLLIEDGWMSTGEALGLIDAGFQLESGSKTLARWREFRDHEDLSFAVIAHQASRYSIESALEFAEKRVRAGEKLTELDIYQYAIDKIADFRREFEIPFAIAPFFTNLHASNRTNHPANPVDFEITKETVTIKFDAGYTVSSEGVILGTSDMARSLTFDEPSQEAFELFHKIVRESIAQVRPGVTCEQVHDIVVHAIDESMTRLVEIGLAPDLAPLKKDFITEYRKRNVGHYMGKQESFTTEFRPGHTHAVHEGSVCAIEIQWPYNLYSIAAEDLFFVGVNETFVTSS